MKMTAQAPATVANLIVGFDTLALAIGGLYDEVSLTPNDTGNLRIMSIENGPDIPLDASKNVCTLALDWMRRDQGDDSGYDMSIVKGYQAGSGLGSSAASAVAALWAYNAQLGYPLSREAVIPYAMKSEEFVSGNPIADNVAAAALGGVVLIRSDVQRDFIQLPVPDIYVGCLLPNIQVITREAREILPASIPLRDGVKQGANLAGFISALYSSDWELMKRSMTDHIIEQYRAPLIPHYFDAKKIAMECGAICFGIAGSGPAVFYFCEDETNGRKIAEEITAMWQHNNIKAISEVRKINTKGAHTIAE